MDPAAGAPPSTGRRRWWRRLLVATALLVLLAFGMHAHVLASASGRVFAPESVPAADCILVPGARIHADGRPFGMLVDRLQAAHDLFVRGKATRIVLSGLGGGGLGTDEVAAMRRWLEARGVPAAALVDDPAGLRTIDTMRRCRGELGMRSAIVVTNPFHLARCLFLAQHCGLDAHGVEAPLLFDYSTGTLVRNQGREVLARLWAWSEVFVLGRTSQSVGG
ncbi:MAG: YdcF family protein [Planctomycetes bacterium]|nr:YdcF family protein [Planctomycetota bacterium]